MTKDKLKKEWIILATKNANSKNKYFYGQVIEILDIDDGQVILVEGYLDNVAIRVNFPELKNSLNDEFYTPIKLFLNGGKAELLDEKNMLQTLENLKFDFSSEETPYFLYEDLENEQSTFKELEADNEGSKYFIDFWKANTAKPFDGMTQSEVDDVIAQYNLPLTIVNKPKQLLFSGIFFLLLGFSILYLLLQESSYDYMMLGISIFLVFGGVLSFFLYFKPSIVILTEKGIEIEGIRSFKILWSEIESINIFANRMITYMPNESSSKKKVFGGYVIPLQQKPLEKTLFMLQELHYFYGEFKR